MTTSTSDTSHIIEKTALAKLVLNQLELNPGNRKVFFHQQEVTLTGLEFNLLIELLQNAGDIVSRETIAEKVFRRKIHQCDKSINSHIANIRRKLLAIDSSQPIKTVRGLGYVCLLQC
ncbi:winged helix-turn-helix domain-containing protein [Litorilituus sediminis]|uniref:Winged helix family transcriptional regulator n=1 Tax=Litorilituus sediminis TaxID=718192 RepID=A0A4P6P593_9GAMM|nr:winged helix-turn-helix domain-containing protein [Litorilituus sediminis]QBG36138.1 winged helix family transcriptional regulator [Litorilituus sediminis]